MLRDLSCAQHTHAPLALPLLPEVDPRDPEKWATLRIAGEQLADAVRQDAAWRTSFPSAPGPLQAPVEAVVRGSQGVFGLSAAAAARAVVGRLQKAKGRLRVLMGRGDAAKARDVREEVHEMEKQVHKIHERRGDRAFEGCSVIVKASDGSTLAKSRIIRLHGDTPHNSSLPAAFDESMPFPCVLPPPPPCSYDVRKNLVRLADPVDSISPDIAPGAKALASASPFDAVSSDPRPRYAISWLDFLSRALPLSLACALTPRHAQLMVEHAVRIPSSRNIPRLSLPYPPPAMLLRSAAGLLFPASARFVQVRTDNKRVQTRAASDDEAQNQKSAEIEAQNQWSAGKLEVLEVIDGGTRMLVEGVCGAGFPREGDALVWDAEGAEWEGNYKDAKGVIPRERRGPQDLSQLTHCTLGVALDSLLDVHPSKVSRACSFGCWSFGMASRAKGKWCRVLGLRWRKED